MSVTAEKVDTDDLTVGMYISRLDRPWLETPFLFQGFTIKSTDEIEELKRYCKYVYIDKVNDSRVEPVQQTVAPRPPGAKSNRKRLSNRFPRLARWLRKRPEKEEVPPGEFYADTVPVSAEIPQARKIHSKASSVLKETMEAIRTGAKLDVQILESAISPMIESVLRNRDAMTWLSRIKQTDDYTYGHSVSCSVYSIAFGRHLGLPKQDLKILGLGGMLLDVGKTRIPKQLLSKRDPLSEEEMALMRRHVLYSEEMLRDTRNIDRRVLEMVRSHHERYDGSGYPDGLKGPEIPVFARIAGIVDFYDALITPRSYAPPISPYDAMRELHKRQDGEFQSEMVDHFVQAVGMFPNGALVELSTGEVGIVIEQNRVRRLRPKVMVILGTDKSRLDEFTTIDLRDRPAEPGEPGAIWIDRGVEIGAYGIEPAEYFL